MADQNPDENQTPQSLERSLGLPAALAIGVGTMVGAGVFVFPGLAGGAAGAGASISFVIAGCIAMLVALCTAELATAMPSSGGGYFFVSRVMGPRLGTLVGLGQGFGLIFATAFYLTGLAKYLLEFLAEFNIDMGEPVALIGVGFAILMLALNLFGTEKVGQAQNYIVAGLLVILLTLFGYGVLSVFGVVGESNLPEAFVPEGWGPVFSTTALVFTSFLGFVQIATVAGEVKAPHKTLPRALIGSVLIATFIYVLVLFVTTSLFPAEELAEMGETATVEVARSLVGRFGAIAILFAGLLATLSSANASIMSASRTVYALGKDKLLSERVGQLHPKYGTPHIGLAVVGLPIIACMFLGRIEVLAEVASLLHLILYGLICVTLILCRRRKPLWFAPTYRIPGYPVVPIIGAIACFALIGWMEWLSMAIGGGVIVLSLIYFYAFDRGKKVSAPSPTHIAPALRRPYILLPINVDPEIDDLPQLDFIDNFGRLELLALGYYKIPEQTTTDQAREEYGEAVKKQLETDLESLPVAGKAIKSETAFTSDLPALMGRYLEEENCQAILFHHRATRIERLVLPVSEPEEFGIRMVTVLRELVQGRQLPVLVLLLDEGEDEWSETFEEDARGLMNRAGVRAGEFTVTHADTNDLTDALANHTEANDFILLRETERDNRQKNMKRVLNDTETAVLLVLEKRETDADER
ncbi:APC family permease [Neolewinella antarctica]|uniref:Amino acid transporter n=1 Tax=Neolewinella antarctica TaxID=442734 RepID=A0ABX0XGD9_9BACT|nr:APC family permease [Neolewinella antarctica]NJC28380.1 amino acid transporter [Neolewinella antarctica]